MSKPRAMPREIRSQRGHQHRSTRRAVAPASCPGRCCAWWARRGLGAPGCGKFRELVSQVNETKIKESVLDSQRTGSLRRGSSSGRRGPPLAPNRRSRGGPSIRDLIPSLVTHSNHVGWTNFGPTGSITQNFGFWQARVDWRVLEIRDENRAFCSCMSPCFQ